MRKRVEFTAWFGDKSMPVDLGQPPGVPGEYFHVLIANYFYGTIEKKDGYWTANFSKKVWQVLTIEDVREMGERIDEQYPEGGNGAS